MPVRGRNIFALLAVIGVFTFLGTHVARAAQAPVLYVGDSATNAVYLFDARDLSRPPIGKITDGIGTPYGLAVDGKGFLYVANGSAVEVYRPGALTPFRTITDVAQPFAVGIGSNGSFAITGIYSQGGLLAIYDNGSRKPTRLISFPPGQIRTEITNPVFDSLGNVFVAVHQYPRGPAKVFRFAPGSTQGVDTGLPFCFALGIDAQNNLYVSFGSEINVYHPGSLTPFRQITNGLVSTTELAITPTGGLFVVNTEHLVGGIPSPGNVVEYTPHGKNPTSTLQQACCDSKPLSAALHLGG
jgi:hypothetical protein